MMKYQGNIASRCFDIFNYTILCLLTASFLYPFIYMFAVSISDPMEVALLKINLLPKGFQLDAYKTVLTDNQILRAYFNSITYTLVGTSLTLLFSCLAAYPLSRKNFKGRKFFVIVFTITMFFSGGMIPGFLNIQKLGLMNTIWAVVLPGAFGMWNIILIRTSFQQIPNSLIESAYIDGASEWGILFKIVLPLSKAIIATIAVFASVNYWNSYFPPLLYLTSPEKSPLTIILRRVLIANEVLQSGQEAATMGDRNPIIAQGKLFSIRMATIFIAIGPIILVYPFVQKYFVKGVMIGAIKE